MILWIVLTLTIALLASALTVPLVRRYDARAVRNAPSRPVYVRVLPWAVLGVMAVAIAGAALYARLAGSDFAGAPVPAGLQTAGTDHPTGDVTSMIAGLEARLEKAPDDPEGWWMLGWSYMRTGRSLDAANAYGRAVSLKPDNVDYLSAQGEALVQAATGKVSPEALAIFRRVVAAAPADPRARYYLAVFKDQNGDGAGAMEDWIALIKSAPPGAPWGPEIRGFVEGLARERGLDISAKLPPLPAAAATPGPTPAQIASANQMPDSQRQAMIHGMVDTLAAKLKEQPRDADGWVRLMRARMVLGEKDQAAAAYRDARAAFADTPSEQGRLRDAARDLGIPGA